MRKLGIFVLAPIVSFLAGFFVYNWILLTYWDQNLGGDAYAVLFSGGIAFAIVAMPIYFGVIRFIDKKFSEYAVILYPIFCSLVFLLPVGLIMAMWGGGSFFSPESMLFYSFFGTSGFVFGSLTWLFKRKRINKSSYTDEFPNAP